MTAQNINLWAELLVFLAPATCVNVNITITDSLTQISLFLYTWPHISLSFLLSLGAEVASEKSYMAKVNIT